MKSVTVEEFGQALGEGRGVIVLDVRTPLEYARGHLKGSVHVELGALKNRVESVLPDKSKTIYVYCLSGSRSELAVPQLERMGYTNVYNVTNGLLAWRSKGFPLVQDDPPS